ncbi:hypothetical protein niasHT_005715 [Heterodera trifolii]|uniref:3'-5' exonuclease domain-containing protein n=1 Tax=Heterodera trifolii TaxID=157864 RepID=A0ABD2LQV0_9BILA
MDNNLVSSHCFSLFLQIQKYTNSNLDAQSAGATAEEEEGRHRQRQPCADRALILRAEREECPIFQLNRLAHAQGLPNVFQKVSPFGRPPISAKLTNATTCICKLKNQIIFLLLGDLTEFWQFNGFFLSVCVLLGVARERSAKQQIKKAGPTAQCACHGKSPVTANGGPGPFLACEKLCSVDEFAFDFELTCFVHVGHPRDQCICLLQISTEDTDILVDVLVDEVRDNFGPILATIFADKRIKKVCHGAQKRTFLGQLGISRAEPLVDTSGGCRRNLRSLVYERAAFGGQIVGHRRLDATTPHQANG